MGKVIELFDKYEACGETHEPAPYVEESKGTVRLRFKAFDVQSEMNKKAPHELVLRYTRTMVKALSFKKKIRRIGMVGLGGGSIPKYCYRNFPNTDISVAEINSEVIAVRDRFFVPKDDDRFRVHCEDGAEFVARHPAQFDVLFVDGYDEKGQPPQLCDVKFYGDCYRALTLHGMLIVNICDTHEVIPRIQRSFFDRVVLMDSEESCFNTIVVAAKGRTFKALAAQVGSLAMWP